MTLDEIAAFIDDANKFLLGDVELKEQVAGSGQFKFRCAINYIDSGSRIIELNIWRNTSAPTMTVTYFVGGIGRIYGFCLGISHKGMLYHRHLGVGENEVVTPLSDSIARLVDDPAAVWAQFCAETSLTHIGDFRDPSEEPWRPKATEI